MEKVGKDEKGWKRQGGDRRAMGGTEGDRKCGKGIERTVKVWESTKMEGVGGWSNILKATRQDSYCPWNGKVGTET